ncbi:hypothetical protein ACH40F_47870 [Streptomyces sp. NPDC020794]|uniref:hypothetical protein n=1 Tax=unclassified Streptomyces TaxID=2593676 RepID=UPI0036F010F9
MTVQPRTATENDFVLETAGETEINPVLLYALSRQYGLDADTEALADKIATAVEECADPADRMRLAYEILQPACTRSNLTAELKEHLAEAAHAPDVE